MRWGVTEGGGDDALEAEGEDVGGFSCLVVELIADAEEEVVGVADLCKSVRGDDAVFCQLIEIAGAGFHARDPEDVLVVAEAAAGFLHVGFLEEDGVGAFFVAGVEIAAACFEEFTLAFRDAVFAETFEELPVEFGITGDEAGVHE